MTMHPHGCIIYTVRKFISVLGCYLFVNTEKDIIRITTDIKSGILSAVSKHHTFFHVSLKPETDSK